MWLKKIASIDRKRENKVPTEEKPKQLLFFLIKIWKWSRIYEISDC